MPPRALVLFDIDGTLLRRAGPQHREALAGAIRDVCRLETTLEGVGTHGKLDRDLIRSMMEAVGAGQTAIDEHLPDIVRRAQLVYRATCPDLRRRVCPGVRIALGRLHRARIPMGLVTGNLTAIGWRKVERAGLQPFFRFGAFAEEAHTRAGLVALALRRARRAGWLKRDTAVTLIGDHSNDVQAAKLNGIRSIAVATGALRPAELAPLRPDLVLPDLRALKIEMVL